MKHEFHGVLTNEGEGDNIDVEDCGQAKIGTIFEGDSPNLFVRIQSWVDRTSEDDEPVHVDFDNLVGKKLKITVEVI